MILISRAAHLGRVSLILLSIFFINAGEGYAQADQRLGNYYYRTEQFYRAIDHFTQDLNTAPKGNHEVKAQLITKVGNCYFKLGEYSNAIMEYKKARKIISDYLGNHVLGAACDLNASLAFEYIKQIELKKTSKNREKTKIQNYSDSAALSHFRTGIDTYNAVLNGTGILPDKGTLLELLMESRFPSTKEILYQTDFDNFIERVRSRFGENHPDQLIFLTNKGMKCDAERSDRFASWYTRSGSFMESSEEMLSWEQKIDRERDLAFECFRQSVLLASQWFGEKSPFASEAHLNLARYCSGLNRDQRKVLDGLKASRNEATQYAKTTEWKYQRLVIETDEEALLQYGQALGSVLKKYDRRDADAVPEIGYFNTGNIKDDCLSLMLARKAILGKVELLRDMPYIQYTLDDWARDYMRMFSLDASSIFGPREFVLAVSRHALDLMKFYDQFVDIYTNSILNQRDQLHLSNLTRRDRLIGVNVAFNKFYNEEHERGIMEMAFGIFQRITIKNHVKKSSLLDAFYFVEKTKGLLLLRALNTENAATSAIPDSVLDRKSKLVDRITLLKLKLSEDAKESSPELLRLTNDLRILEEHLEKTYEAYLRSKRAVNVSTVQEIQSALEENTAILSYVITQSDLSSDYNIFYQFTITRNEIEIRTRSLRSEKMDYQVRAMRNGIIYQSTKLFEESAWDLQKKLIPKIPDGITNLVIIPDDYLHIIPFEALLTEKIKKKDRGNTQLYKYLIEQYNISYAFSATLHTKTANKQSGSGGLLAIAPVFSDNYKTSESSVEVVKQFDQLDSTNTRGILKNGSYVSPIPNTEKEVKNLKDQFTAQGIGTNVLTFKEATEEKLKSEDLSKYRFIHLATHGFVNTQNPDMSGLLLEYKDAGKEDGVLLASEIAGLKLNAYLVSLSACETGLGRIELGEGVIGLSRAFALAGAQNLVVSYWQVADESTAQLMIDFYKSILGGSTTLAHALREAKLGLIRSSTFSDPYYWSPFVLIGH